MIHEIHKNRDITDYIALNLHSLLTLVIDEACLPHLHRGHDEFVMEKFHLTQQLQTQISTTSNNANCS